MIPLAAEEIDLPQKGTLRPSTEPDVQPQHNLCFCQGIDRPDKLPKK